MKFLITGGAGFIGSNIAQYLVKTGDKVRILDDFSTGKRENLSGIENKIEIIEGDIRDYDTVAKAVRGVDFVLHLAALPSVARSVKDPITSNEVNVTGTLNVLEASRLAKVKKIVSSSSSSVYGDTAKLPVSEIVEPTPLSPYAVGKLAGEYYARVYWELYKLPTVSLRYFNVFGPCQDPDGDYAAVIPRFILALVNNSRPIVFGDGEQTRDFIYVEDAVQANILAATKDEIVGTEYNVASGRQYSLNQLLENLREVQGNRIQAEYAEPRPGDIRHSFADISKLKAHGYDLKLNFRQGLEKTVEYFTKLHPSSKIVSKVNR